MNGFVLNHSFFLDALNRVTPFQARIAERSRLRCSATCAASSKVQFTRPRSSFAERFGLTTIERSPLLTFEGGRIWYTALGHAEASYSEPLFLQHLLGGIQFVAGLKEADRKL